METCKTLHPAGMKSGTSAAPGQGGREVLAPLGAGGRAAGRAPSRVKGWWGPWSNMASGIAEAGRGQGVTMTKLSKWFGRY